MAASVRSDGRHAYDLRPLSQSNESSRSRADATSSFSFGTVTVQASLSGPQEVRQKDESLGQATLDINVSPLRGLSNLTHKASAQTLSVLLKPLIQLHLHPRSLIQITLQFTSALSTKYSKPFTTYSALSGSGAVQDGEEEDDVDQDDEEADGLEWPSCVQQAALLNAAVLACIESGISMKGTASAIGLARSSSTGQWLLDPTPHEEREADLCLVLGFAFGVHFGGKEGQMIWCETVKAKSGFDEAAVSSPPFFGFNARKQKLK